MVCVLTGGLRYSMECALPWKLTVRVLCCVCLCVSLITCQGSERLTSKSTRSAQLGNTGTYCADEIFSATCDVGEVVLITRAVFGRMRIGRCVKQPYGHIGCAADVVTLVDSKCSGRRSCELRVADKELSATKPCPDDLKAYLHAEYQCMTVQTSNVTCYGNRPIHVTSSSGVLASLITDATGCGSLNAPWVITALPGQTISVTLYDFNVHQWQKESLQTPKDCHLYGVIRERVGARVNNETMCGGSERQKHYYTSTTNRIEVGLLRQQEEGDVPHFFMRYQAIGCADIPRPVHSRLSRHGNIITVKCNHSNEAYELQCMGNQWIGEPVNCSRSYPHQTVPTEETYSTIPYGMSVLIVLAIALTIGLFVLLAGLIFLRRHWFFCTGRPLRTARSSTNTDMDQKDYVSSMWIRSRDSPLESRKNWREGDSFSTYTTSELPPCTPLMERGPRPPLYGQVQQQQLPCGCSTYVDSGETSKYMSRQQLLQNSGGRQEKLILKPGEPAQYFIVEGDCSENCASSSCVKAVEAQSQCVEQPSGSASGQPDVRPSRPNVVMQTEDNKIRLRVSDVPCDTQGVVPVSERQPLMDGGNIQEWAATSQQSTPPPLPDISYPAVCKERLDNEVNDGGQVGQPVFGQPRAKRLPAGQPVKCPQVQPSSPAKCSHARR